MAAEEVSEQAAMDEAIKKSQEALDLIKRSRRTEIEYFCDGKVPLDTQGTMKLPQIPPRRIVHEYIKAKSIEDDVLKEHLFNDVLVKFMEALGAQDEAALRQVTEKTFADKIVADMPILKSKDLKYKSASDVNPDSVYLIDKLFLKGVSADRSENDTNFDYEVITSMEAQGLKQYIHKFNLGMTRYYYM